MDPNYYDKQEKIVKFIYSQVIVNWRRVHYVCKQLISADSDEIIEWYGKYPEYKLFLPLIRLGIIEIASKNNKPSFIVNPHYQFTTTCGLSFTKNQPDSSRYIKSLAKFDSKSFNPTALLSLFPSIVDLISNFIEEDISLKLKCKLCNGYQYIPIQDSIKSVGIYKSHEEVYYPAYLLDDKGKIRRICDYSEAFEDLNYARLYCRAYDYEILFEYNSTLEVLTCFNVSELPILVFRALLMNSPLQLLEEKFYKPSCKIELINIKIDTIEQLKRIFGEQTVEVING